MTAFAIEQVRGELPPTIFNPMVSLVKKLPNNSEFNDKSYPEIHAHFNAKTKDSDPTTALFVAQRRMPLAGHTVGLAGVEIHDDVARVTELVVDDRVRGNRVGWQLLKFVAEWADEHNANTIEVSPPPKPNSIEEAWLQEMGFAIEEGTPRMGLEDSQLIKH